MTTSTVQISDVWTLTIERSFTTVYSDSPEPDKKWRFVDAEGHEHTYNPSPADHYPTLRWVVDCGWFCDEHNEDHDTGHYECAVCGETITPGMVGPSIFPERVATGQRATLTYDDGWQRWEYYVPADSLRWTADASMVDWAEDIAATVEGRLISRTFARR